MPELNLPTPNKSPGDGAPADDTNLIIEAINTLNSAVENIPAGPQGPQGEPGTPGAAGANASVTVGSTTTSAPGSNAAVTNSGTAQNAVFNFTIPRGATGPQGAQGPQGPQGPPGEAGTPGAAGAGVKTGGLTGQVLQKASNNDFDTQWAFPANAPVTSVDGRQGAVTLSDLYDAAGAAAAAQSDAEDYADSLATNYDPAGAASTAVSNHNSDTTSVHGISNTADLVYTSDARLSNARTPTAHAASHGSAGSDAITIAQSQVTDLTTDLSGKASATDLSNHTGATTNVHGITNTANLVYTNDSRLSDQRTPLDNSVTSAKIVNGTIVDEDISGTAAIAPSKINGTAVVDSDARLTNARTPTAHASSHGVAGSDPITVAQSQVTNLGTDLAAKANLASPTFTGTPAAPTAAVGTNTTQIATTEFVNAEISNDAVLKSLVDAKGDLLVGTADNTVARLPVGTTNGFVLTVDSNETAGVKWAVAAAPVDDPFPVGFFLGGM